MFEECYQQGAGFCEKTGKGIELSFILTERLKKEKLPAPTSLVNSRLGCRELRTERKAS